MNSQNEKIVGTEEAWDARLLGSDEQYVAVCNDNEERAIQAALGLEEITLTLSQDVMVPVRLFAAQNGIDEKLLMQQVLTRFVECETRHLMTQMLSEEKKRQEQVQQNKGRYVA